MASILIVDDDRLILTGLANGLEERGYVVHKAATGEEAVALADTVEPDLVLMDICLPGISGTEAARRIQERANVPVIFLSALDNEEIVRVAIALGSLSYLVKPITISQLVPAVENALARSRDISKLRTSEEHLSTALTQSRDISVAIGMLMERYNVTAEDAFEMLRAQARSTRLKTMDIAKDVISGALQFDPKAR
jgi:two-component system, response regulator PdtaR